MRISNLGVVASLNALTALLDAGISGAVISIYTGSQPASVETVATGTLLGTVTCAATAFAGAVDATGSATATAAAIVSGLAVADGTAGWFRVTDSNGLDIIDGNVGQGSGELNLDDNTLVINDNINVTSWVITLPE